jgi:DNA (cytosine-5)-methyltransferase 1
VGGRTKNKTMSKKKSYITVTDQFCGAGGSSQGVRSLSNRSGGGIEVKLALNHWKLAIETHNTNFPDAFHDCTDVSACDPRRYISTDILITSPECTNHSLAKGQKVVKSQMELYDQGKIDPAADRSRATMWDVPRFAEYHNYNAIIVENVVDARKWVMFDSWLQAMHALGYNHRCVYLNSMHCHPTPQSRDRMYVVFWKKGNKPPLLDFSPKAWCPKCESDIDSVQTFKKTGNNWGKYRKQYVYCCPIHTIPVKPYYYAAFNAIDWSDIGKRIGDRKKALSENTIKRIEYGLNKYGKDPFLVLNYSPGYSKPINQPVGAITCQDHHGIVSPFIIKGEHSEHMNLRSSADVFQTQATRQTMSLVVPFVVELNASGKARDISQPVCTVTADGNHHGLVTTEKWNSFLASYNNGSHCVKHVSEEAGAVTTNDRLSITTFKDPKIEDCYYRMLRPPEIKAAMAFEQSYIVLGDWKEQVRQLGNAVTPPAMEWLVGQVVDSLK